MWDKPYLTSNEVAALLRVSPATIRQWTQKGMLDAEYTPGGHRRFMAREIERFAKSFGISLHDSQKQLRILVVDDDKQLTAYLAELLSTMAGQSQIEVAHDGFDAGAKVFRFQPHVILLDLMMPGMDGFEVCQLLKNDPMTKAIRVIAMTGYPLPEHIERIIAVGAEACMSKPLVVEEVFAAIGLRDQRSDNLSTLGSAG